MSSTKPNPEIIPVWYILSAGFQLTVIVCRVPFIITLLLVSICAAQQSRLHQALVDVSFLFGEVQVSTCECKTERDTSIIMLLIADPLSGCADCLLLDHNNMHLCYCFDHSGEAPPFKEDDLVTMSFIPTH